MLHLLHAHSTQTTHSSMIKLRQYSIYISQEGLGPPFWGLCICVYRDKMAKFNSSRS